MKAFKVTFQSGYSFIDDGTSIEAIKIMYPSATVEEVKIRCIAGRFVY